MRAFDQPPTPPGLVHPNGIWFFDWVIPIAGSAIILLVVADCVRRRRLTWGFLFVVNSMLVYWMETIGDWGQELVYSPAFARHHLLDWLPLKTPNDPIFMPFAYALYWSVHAIIVLWLGQQLVKRYGWSLLKSVAILAVPVNYAWDFFTEGIATHEGWWTYDPGMGPHVRWSGGGQITLLWTIGLMCVWPNLIAYWGGKPPVRGLNHFERFFALERFTRPKVAATAGEVPSPPLYPSGGGDTLTAIRPTPTKKEAEYDDGLNYEVTVARWKFELARFGAWFVTFQISFLLLVVPLVVMRAVTGHDSIYAP